MAIRLTLPYPPSLSKYWRAVDGRNILSKAGRVYRVQAHAAILEQVDLPIQTMDGSLSVEIIAMMPDRRRRDLDNILKAVCDILSHARIYQDDSQIDRLLVERGPVNKPAFLHVVIKEFM